MDLPKKASVEDEKRADNPTNLTIVGTLPTRGKVTHLGLTSHENNFITPIE